MTSALETYNEAANSIHEKKKTLNGEGEKLSRQREYFLDAVERCEVINDTEAGAKAKKGLVVIDEKLRNVERELEQLDLTPLAQMVFVEVEQRLSELKGGMEEQWQRIVKARIAFLQELKQLGDLRQEAGNLCYSTGGAAIQLRRNPLPAPGISGQHQFVVDLGHINQLIRS
jgi:hypothetical protein